MTDAALEAVLRRDRAIVAAALFVLAGLAWAYVLWLAADMDMGDMDMSGFRMKGHQLDKTPQRPLLTQSGHFTQYACDSRAPTRA